MPPVIAAIGAAAASIGASFTISGFLFSLASSLVLGAISRALTPKPKKPSFGSFGSSNLGGLTQTVREPLSTRKIVYGQTRLGGTLVLVAGTEENKYLHWVIALTDHEVESIDEIWINDYSIPNDWLDSNGLVTQGRYEGKIRIKKALGYDGQLADADLNAEVPGWTSEHKLRGVAYVYCRFEYDQDKFPGGIPSVSAFVKGKKIFDPRVSAARFTTNAALFQYDYLTNDRYGFNAVSDINETALIASANICDEIIPTTAINYTVSSVDPATDIITISADVLSLVIGDEVEVSSTGDIPGGLAAATKYYAIPYQFKDTPRIKLAATFQDSQDGIAVDITDAGTATITITKTGEPRYHGGGVVDTANQLENNLIDMLTATAGQAIYVGGKWIIKAAAYTAPTVTLDENDFIEPIVIQTMVTRSERFNAVKGVYRTPLNYDVASDWPALVSSTFATQDGDQIFREYDANFTQRPQNARRNAKIQLLKSRQEILFKCVCNLRAMQLQCGDNVMITFEKYGWNEKIFEVTNFSLVNKDNEGAPAFGVQLILRETDASVYDWQTSEEQEIDPAPNTDLPNPFDIQAVTGVAANSRAVKTVDNDTLYIISMQWNEHPDSFVRNNGFFEIQYKTTYLPPDYGVPNPDWLPSFFVSGALTYTDIAQASAGVLYDMRIRAVNNIGVRSEWVSLLGISAGSGGGVTSSEDWGNFVDTFTSAEDWGDFVTSPATAENWGGFV